MTPSLRALRFSIVVWVCTALVSLPIALEARDIVAILIAVPALVVLLVGGPDIGGHDYGQAALYILVTIVITILPVLSARVRGRDSVSLCRFVQRTRSLTPSWGLVGISTTNDFVVYVLLSTDEL